MRHFSYAFLMIGSVVLLTGCSPNPPRFHGRFHGGSHLPITLVITGDDITNTLPSPTPDPNTPTPPPNSNISNIDRSKKIQKITRLLLSQSPFTTIIQQDQTTGATFTAEIQGAILPSGIKTKGFLSEFKVSEGNKNSTSSEYYDGDSTTDILKKACHLLKAREGFSE